MTTLNDLRSILSRMRLVKTGDILLADDHNTLVEFDAALVNYLSSLEQRVANVEQQIATLQQPTVEEYGDALPLIDALMLTMDALKVSNVRTQIWGSCLYKLADFKYAITAKWIDDPFLPECWRLGLHKREVAKAIVDAGKRVVFSTFVHKSPSGVYTVPYWLYMAAPSADDWMDSMMGIVMSQWRASWLADELAWAEGIYGSGNVDIQSIVTFTASYTKPDGTSDHLLVFLFTVPLDANTVVLRVTAACSLGSTGLTDFTLSLDKRHVIIFAAAKPVGAQYHGIYLIVVNEDGNIEHVIDFNVQLTSLSVLGIDAAVCLAGRGGENQQVYSHYVPFAGRAVSFMVEEEQPTITPTYVMQYQPLPVP